MKVRYKVRVNKGGLIFIGITVFLGIAAVNTANNLLYLVVSYLLSFMLLSGIFSLYNIRGLDVLLLPPEEVYAKSETMLRLIVKNKKRLPSFLVEIRKDSSKCVFPIVKERAEDYIRVCFDKRGMHQYLRLEVSSSFPIGLFERFYFLDVPINLLVFPAMIPWKEIPSPPSGRKSGQISHHSKKGGYEELVGIREYANEPIKLIHWKLSAKTGNLYVKNMAEDASKAIVLSLDDVEGSMEERISKIAYAVVRLISEGYAVGLRLPHKIIEPSTGIQHKRRLLRELALL
ncbi:MAG: DUF58 domain-containing protein [Aquificaceae bacterium]|nr:DUF58 domain-containing protein [Aquificaceae bacterium]MCS7277624.1 DUF58 domain-containing protein [Aquificaceae bacterium]MDW8424144.1 DUF58 domain-containing protein [Aquificaceae bacterium]